MTYLVSVVTPTGLERWRLETDRDGLPAAVLAEALRTGTPIFGWVAEAVLCKECGETAGNGGLCPRCHDLLDDLRRRREDSGI
jgi:hypothetical protein